MATSWSSWSWKKAGASSLAMAGAITFFTDCVLAQITPDDTLGFESSVVTPNVFKRGLVSDQIDGGAIRGSNLFHSFQQFNIDPGRGVYFTNPAGIENILSRVTGGSSSYIQGRLGVLGNANLFVINPNGIIFGSNASLDISGSFITTTANAIRLGDTGLFSASEPATSNLLTVNPSALFFNAVAAQGIVNQSQAQSLSGETNSQGGLVRLQVPADQTLALVGGNVVLEGGNLTAAGGRIELGSVAGIGEVSLSQTGNSWVFGYDKINAFGDIRLQGGLLVDASGEGGGDVQIQSARLEMTQGARIFADTRGTGAGGEVFVHTTEAIALSEDSRITADVAKAATGTGGHITIETGQLSIQDGSLVRAGADPDSEGQGGNLTVKASESVELFGSSGLFTETQSAGNAGDLMITTRQLSVGAEAIVSTSTSAAGEGGNLTVTDSDSVKLFGSRLLTETRGTGAAGDLTITTRQLSVGDGAIVSTSTSAAGEGGNLTVLDSDSVKLFGRSGLFTQTQGTGAAGDLTITTRQLSVENGAVVSAFASDQGNSGDIKVNASNSVNIFGVSPSSSSSGLFTRSDGGGQAGNITVETSAFQIADGAVVDARTLGEGNGGNITVKANTFEAVNGGQILTTTRSSGQAGNISLNDTDSVTLSGSDLTYADRLARFGEEEVDNEGPASGLFANTAPRSTGDGGSISIDPIKLTITDGAGVAVDSLGKGNAGNLQVQAGSVNLESGAFLSAETASGEGGNITLQAEDLLLMRHNSNISAEAGGTGDGGNIDIDTNFLVAVPSENSDIIANAFEGDGGNIQITAQGIFGTQFRPQLTPESDITASSTFGVSGEVVLNTPDVDPNQGLATLPAELVDASVLIASSRCGVSRRQDESKFIITGRGELPLRPGDAAPSPYPTGTVRSIPSSDPSSETQRSSVSVSDPSTNPTNPAPTQILEATGWVINNKGEVVLTATAPTVTFDIPWMTPANCHTPQNSS